MWQLNESLRRKLSNTASHRLKRRVFFTCTRTKNHVSWLGHHLGRACNKVFEWKNSKYCPIYGHVHHKWLAFFAAKPIRGAGIKKMIPFASQQWPGVFLYHLEGLLLSRCLGFHLNTISDVVLDVHCSSLKQIYSKFCGN